MYEIYILYLSEIILDVTIKKMHVIQILSKQKYFDNKKIIEEIEKYDCMEKLLTHVSNQCLTHNSIYYYDAINHILNTFILETHTQKYEFCDYLKINTIKQINLKYNIISILTNDKFIDNIINQTYLEHSNLYCLYTDFETFKTYLMDTYNVLILSFMKNNYNKLFDLLNIITNSYSDDTNEVFCLLLPKYFTIINMMFNFLIYNLSKILFINTDHIDNICGNIYHIIFTKKSFKIIHLRTHIADMIKYSKTEKFEHGFNKSCKYSFFNVGQHTSFKFNIKYYFYIYDEKLKY